MENPFVIKGYVAKEYFCDREKETAKLIDRAIGGGDSTVISPRRYGKSGLVLHTLDTIKQEHPEYSTLYTDIYSTSSLNDFIDCISSTIMETFSGKSSAGKRFLSFIKSLRPFLSFDQMTGNPQVHFEISSSTQKEKTLKDIFELLGSFSKPIIFAIDEFQQITEYPEKNVEALLRTYTQNLHNVRFIYCGSKRRLMSSIFNDATRPFYASSESLYLEKLDRKVYSRFIADTFSKAGRTIGQDAVDFILDWSRVHTYYTQRICHNIFNTGEHKITIDLVRTVCNDILDSESFNFLQLRDILPTQQWRFLIAIAKEQKASQISSGAFFSKYGIGSAASSARAAKALEDKELVLKTLSKDSSYYEVYNVFFSRWLEREY